MGKVVKRIKIKDLEVGDMIKTYENGEVHFREVKDKFNTIVEKADQRKVTLANGTIVRCSNRHPFMVSIGEGGVLFEVLPDELTSEHVLVLDDNQTTSVISVEGDDQDVNYIDITVDGTETFFAADDIEQNQVLTHNCSQGGIRSSSVTMFYPFWHYEVESLLVLKNNKGTEETRARHSDYGIKLSALFYNRVRDNGVISLFSPDVSKEMYDAFHSSDQALFEKLYVEFENNPVIRRKTIPARELLNMIAMERASTGRIYIVNIDHVNTHSSFLDNVYQSNLCLEITLPTTPFTGTIEDGYAETFIAYKDEKAKEKLERLLASYNFIPRKYEGKLFKRVETPTDIEKNAGRIMRVNTQDKTDAEMALCILAAINLGKVDNLYDGKFEQMVYATVRALDNLIDHQEYPVRAAEVSAKMRRTLGVGVTNFAYYLAKRGLRYSDGSGNRATHELFEAFQYYLIKASVSLAKERGACEWFDRTKYSKGILPIDTYHKGLDGIGKFDLKLDWEALRADVLKYGMRHSTLSAQMPVESSSKTTSSTNGIEMPKQLYSSKDSVPFVVPEINELYANYETMWEQPSNTGYMNLVAIMQKFMDQAISANTFYDPSKFPDNKVPLKLIIRDIVTAYKLGYKTMYYHYTNDDDDKEEGTNNTPLPQSPEDEGGECESCKI